MIVSWKHLILTFPLLAGFIILFYLVGSIVSFFAKKKTVENGLNNITLNSIFWKLFTGFCFTTSLYAIIITNFQTCLLPVPVLIFFVERTSKPIFLGTTTQTGFLNKKRTLLFCFLAFIIYWFTYASHFISFDSDWVNYIHYDTAYYGRAGSYLNFIGKENVSLDYLGFSYTNAEPYHYGDLWLIAMVEKVSGIHATVITHTVVYPFFLILFIIGITGYINSFLPKLNNQNFYYLLLLAGFICSITVMHPWVFIKLFLVACILLAIIYSLRTLAYNQTILLVCLGSLLYITIAPVLVISLFIILGHAFCQKKITIIKIGLSLLLSLLSLAWLIIFYYINYINHPAYINYSTPPFQLKVFTKILAEGAKQFLKLFPFLILLLITLKANGSWRKINFTRIPQDLLFLIILPFTGLLIWSLLYTISYESTQFFQNIFSPVSCIMAILISSYAFLSKKILPRILALLVLTAGMLLNYSSIYNTSEISKKDLTAVQQFFTKYPKSYFVSLQADEEFNSIYKRNTVYSQPLIFIDYLISPYVNISLNTPDLYTTSISEFPGEDKKTIQSSPFFQYTNRQKKQLTTEEYMYSFVKEKNIHFLTASNKATIPYSLKAIIEDSVIINTENWKIYYLGL